ncbi:hypothetical protein VOLCADRAFT_92376 [Volvox carteri f. nagariensis]|uniref:Uncharacterized protein n=1 Tax=Volvox carteri f. nagariensis TaxID=3068 RepID=D8TZH9_VOLCA|nr:uncharacterized protein VOLCADRAFT_92376 [Volvox carteri f. nagariensis]EFJ47184.1 hypothetical protein VOLCADRAFT_92376 [Volvox carteri f. nagariensis]|eukprot:XP_002951733.1 hypothetical protein VOLCADRAFT_92376 [Volvox carteri f. nagariensis]
MREHLAHLISNFDVYDMAVQLTARVAEGTGGSCSGAARWPPPPGPSDSLFQVLIPNEWPSVTTVASSASSTSSASVSVSSSVRTATGVGADAAELWASSLPSRVMALFIATMQLVELAKEDYLGVDSDMEEAKEQGEGKEGRQRLAALTGRRLLDQAVVLLDALVRYCGGPSLLYSELELLAYLVYGTKAVLTSVAMLCRVARRIAVMASPPYLRRILHMGTMISFIKFIEDAPVSGDVASAAMEAVGRALGKASVRLRPFDSRRRVLDAIRTEAAEALEQRRQRTAASAPPGREHDSAGAALQSLLSSVLGTLPETVQSVWDAEGRRRAARAGGRDGEAAAGDDEDGDDVLKLHGAARDEQLPVRRRMARLLLDLAQGTLGGFRMLVSGRNAMSYTAVVAACDGGEGAAEAGAEVAAALADAQSVFEDSSAGGRALGPVTIQTIESRKLTDIVAASGQVRHSNAVLWALCFDLAPAMLESAIAVNGNEFTDSGNGGGGGGGDGAARWPEGRDFIVVPIVRPVLAGGPLDDPLAAYEFRVHTAVARREESRSAVPSTTPTASRSGGAGGGTMGGSGSEAGKDTYDDDDDGGRGGGGGGGVGPGTPQLAGGSCGLSGRGGRGRGRRQDPIPDVVKPFDDGDDSCGSRTAATSTSSSSSFSHRERVKGPQGVRSESSKSASSGANGDSGSYSSSRSSATTWSYPTSAAPTETETTSATATTTFRLRTHWRQRRAHAVNWALCCWLGLTDPKQNELDQELAVHCGLSGSQAGASAESRACRKLLEGALAGVTLDERILVPERLILLVLECQCGHPERVLVLPNALPGACERCGGVSVTGLLLRLLQLLWLQWRLCVTCGACGFAMLCGRRHREGPDQLRKGGRERLRQARCYAPHRRAAATSAATSAFRKRDKLIMEIEEWRKFACLERLYSRTKYQLYLESQQLAADLSGRRRPNGATHAEPGCAENARSKEDDVLAATAQSRHLVELGRRLHSTALGLDVYGMATQLLALTTAAAKGPAPPTTFDSIFAFYQPEAVLSSVSTTNTASASAASSTSSASVSVSSSVRTATGVGADAAELWASSLPSRVMALFIAIMQLVELAKEDYLGVDSDMEEAKEQGEGKEGRQRLAALTGRQLLDQAVVLLDALVRYCGGPSLLYSELEPLAYLVYGTKESFANDNVFLEAVGVHQNCGGAAGCTTSSSTAAATPPQKAVLTSVAVLCHVARRIAMTSPPLSLPRATQIGSWRIPVTRAVEVPLPDYLVRRVTADLGRVIGHALAHLHTADARQQVLDVVRREAAEMLNRRRQALNARPAGTTVGDGGGLSEATQRWRLLKQQQQPQDRGDDEGGGGRGGALGAAAGSNVVRVQRLVREIDEIEAAMSVAVLLHKMLGTLPKTVQSVWDAEGRRRAATAGGRDGEAAGGDDEDGDDVLKLHGAARDEQLPVRRRMARLLLDLAQGRRKTVVADGPGALSWILSAAAVLGRFNWVTSRTIAGCGTSGGAGGTAAAAAATGPDGAGDPEPRAAIAAATAAPLSSLDFGRSVGDFTTAGLGPVMLVDLKVSELRRRPQLGLRQGSVDLWVPCTDVRQLGTQCTVWFQGDELENRASSRRFARELQWKLDEWHGAVLSPLQGAGGGGGGLDALLAVLAQVCCLHFPFTAGPESVLTAGAVGRVRTQFLDRGRDFVVVPVVEPLPAEQSCMDLLGPLEVRLRGAMLRPYWRQRRALVLNWALCCCTGLIGSDNLVTSRQRRELDGLMRRERTGEVADDGEVAGNPERVARERRRALLVEHCLGPVLDVRHLVSDRLIIVVLECRPGNETSG